jgi:uncharacterized protein DUF5317
MLLVIGAILCVLSVPLAGGRLARLADLDVKATWTVLVAAAVQVAVTSVYRTGYTTDLVLHAATYGLVIWFLIANRRIAGVPLLSLGVALNTIAIAANGGVMPATRTALRIAGIDTSGGYSNSAAVAHPKLQVLGDVIPVPGPWPIGNVLSVGDLLIFAGALIVLHVACRRPASRAAASA